MKPEYAYRGVRITGELCHFGSESAAANFAGKRGKVMAIPININMPPKLTDAATYSAIATLTKIRDLVASDVGKHEPQSEFISRVAVILSEYTGDYGAI